MISRGIMRLVGTIGLVAVSLMILAGCGSQPGQSNHDLRIEVSIPPQAYFVERIAGPDVKVSVLLPPGQSPETYDPTPRQMTELADATVYFMIGVPFETNLAARIKSSMPRLDVVDTREGVPLRQMAENLEGESQTAEPAEKALPDPHIWLNPMLVKIQAGTIYRTLAGLLPADSLTFRENLAAFDKSLDSLDQLIGSILAPVRGRKMYVFHPAYGYLAHRYGLREVAVQVEGKEPSAQELGDLITQARRDRVTALFVQPQFSTQAAQAVADAIGCKLVYLDPLARDYPSNLVDIARKIVGALKNEPAGQ